MRKTLNLISQALLLYKIKVYIVLIITIKTMIKTINRINNKFKLKKN